MSSKGAITISQDELIRMKVRANLISSCTSFVIQLIFKKIELNLNISRVLKGQINGEITQKI